MLSPNEKPLFVIDIDGTILDCFTEPPRLLPGSELLLGALSLLGEVHLWSASGEEHARSVAAEFDLAQYVTSYHAKPDYPPTEEASLKILGRVAALQIDDDVTERVADWPFVHTDVMAKLYPDN